MTISISWLTVLLFIAIRLSTVLLFTPIQAIRQLSVHTRLLFIFIFSMLLTSYVPNNYNLNNKNILISSIAEFSNGLILSASLYASFAVFQIAGQLIDNETGLNSLAIFNPGEHTTEPVTSHLLSMLAVLFFFGLDGHIWLFKGLAYSFVIIPPGTIALFSGFTAVINQFGFMFTMALMIASPLILALLTIDLCGAVITRNMPQINTYFLILPIKILVGFILLAMLLDYINPITNRVFESCFQTWQEFMS